MVGSGAIVDELPVDIAARGNVLSGGSRFSATMVVSYNEIISFTYPGPTRTVVIRVMP